MSHQPTPSYDLVVVGGGPSGSTLATAVALRGGRVLLVERESFPRHQIGESLLPATVHGIGSLLGVRERLAAAGFPRKNGGTFRWGSAPQAWEFSFSSSDRFGGDGSFAYQVERSKFDAILLDNAREKGVEVRERCSAVGVIEDGDRVVGLQVTGPGGTVEEIHARIVADTSGNTSRIARRIGGQRIYSDYFRNIAVFGYYTGGARLPEPRSGNIFCPTFDDGWFWYIPLSDTLTSVGAVIRPDAVAAVQADPEAALDGFVERCPEIAELLRDGTRIVDDGHYGRVRVRKDYSYHQTRFWRPGMLLAGDAACFVDPVLSSGVHLATYGALMAARSVNALLAGEIEEKDAFEEFEFRYRREYARFYEYLVSFYGMNADADGYFWAAKKVTRADATEVAAFAELVGGGSSGESVLIDPEAVRGRIDARSAELAAAVGPGDGTGPGLHGARTVREAMQEGVGLQVRAALGDRPRRERPVRPEGLVASTDGLAWTVPNA